LRHFSSTKAHHTGAFGLTDLNLHLRKLEIWVSMGLAIPGECSAWGDPGTPWLRDCKIFLAIAKFGTFNPQKFVRA
jgi:hypothetical protein